MNPTTPADRDRAQGRVRSLTTGAAVTAGVLAVAGAAASAVTFGGRTVSAAQGANAPAPTVDPTLQQPVDGGLQQPVLPPIVGRGGGQPVTSGSS